MAFVVLERHLARRRQLQAVAKDREMTAGEIHDDPIQTMTAVSLRLQRVAKQFANGEASEQVEAARALTDEAIERLRHVMFSLYPETLVEDGLVTALEAYCETYVDPGGLITTIEGDTLAELPAEIGMLAFRLVRNAIANVVRHADASTLSVVVTASDHRLLITVTDDGAGFDVASLVHTTVGHFGIPHARTLAHWAGGSYLTASSPGDGTVVTIDLPIR